MRKILASLLLVTSVAGAGCRTAAPGGGAATGPAAATGAGDAVAAVEGFLAAARAGDVQGMARLFGTAAGPIGTRDPADQVEKRMRALQCYLTHDRMRVVGPAGAAGAGQILVVELRQRELARETRFTAVPGPGRRWLVESFDITPLSDFCRP